MRTREHNRRSGDTPSSVEEPVQTERLRLRPFTEDDLDELHVMWSHPEVGPWVGGVHTDRRQSVEELGEHLRHQERHGFGFWAVEERETGRLVGEVGLMLFESHGPEVEAGWCLVRDVWGRGYAREAAAKWLEIGFDGLGLDRVIAVVLPGNDRSSGLARSLGMRETGRRRAYGREHVLFELGAQEFSRG
jgi:RimJ/RimL family protein N-acetyltransferase